MSVPVLPAHIKTVLVTGAGGFVGQRVIAYLLAHYPSLKIIATDIHPPANPSSVSSDGARLTSVAADLGDPQSLSSLFDGQSIDAVLALHGIMSGGSEADFDLGYRVNVDSHLALLQATRKHHLASRSGSPLPVYTYISGLAVYGGPKCLPDAHVQPAETPLFPETSYGTAKAITELYTQDFTRKGFVDGRILRLPTVAIRAGAPSSAASSFISGLIREPLQGLRSTCPVAASPSDPNLDAFPLYLSRCGTVIRNIVHSLAIPAESFPSYSRQVNVPGITVTTRGILEALREVGGEESLGLVDFEKDDKVLAIMAAWPGSFDNAAALALGFERDDPQTGFLEAVRDFKAELDLSAAVKNKA